MRFFISGKDFAFVSGGALLVSEVAGHGCVIVSFAFMKFIIVIISTRVKSILSGPFLPMQFFFSIFLGGFLVF